MSSRFRVDGVPRDWTAAEADADRPGTPAAINCGGRMLLGFWPDMLLTEIGSACAAAVVCGRQKHHHHHLNHLSLEA